MARKLAMVLEAERAMARGEMEGFLEVLKQLGKAQTHGEETGAVSRSA